MPSPVGGQLAGEGLLQQGLFEFGQGGEFLLVDGFQSLMPLPQIAAFDYNPPLLIYGRKRNQRGFSRSNIKMFLCSSDKHTCNFLFSVIRVKNNSQKVTKNPLSRANNN